jgi:hypothetical protein
MFPNSFLFFLQKVYGGCKQDVHLGNLVFCDVIGMVKKTNVKLEGYYSRL